MSAHGTSHPHSGNRASRPPKDFLRAYIACEPCRRSKAKCELPDPDAPCVKCRRERRECYFDSQRSTRKRRKTERPTGGRFTASTTHESLPDVSRPRIGIDDRVPPHESHDLQESNVHGLADSNNGSQLLRSFGAGHASSTAFGPQHPSPPIEHPGSMLHPDQSPVRCGAPTAVREIPRDAPQPSPQSQSLSSTIIDGDVMRTVLSSSKDALGVLFKAAEERELPGDPVEPHNSNSGLPIHDSPKSTYTATIAPAPIPPSKLSSPAPAVLEIWDACRFVRQGWFSAREAVTYIDL